MTKKKPVAFILLFSGFILLFFLLMQPFEIIYYAKNIALLFPKGIIALRERNLLLVLQALMLLVVIPVYLLTFIFSWKYHAGNKKAKYEPNLEDSQLAEYVWWGLPFIIVLIIGTLTWIETYQLDPFKPIESDKKPVTIQVVALQWKWLFIYPEEKIATLNYLQIPEKTPINFEITADAPMNSFWIPQLGGQIYAMPSMKTKLHLMASEPGVYRGASANLSGEGFSGMHFITNATSEEDYQQWIESAKESQNTLSIAEYEQLALPSQNNPVTTYSLSDEKIFDQILMKYMQPQTQTMKK